MLCIVRSTLGDAFAVAQYHESSESLTRFLSEVAALRRARQTKQTAARLRGHRNDKTWRRTPSGKLSSPTTGSEDLHLPHPDQGTHVGGKDLGGPCVQQEWDGAKQG